MYNYNKLIGKIIEICGTRREFAKKMGISIQALAKKLQGENEFKKNEILKACEILKLNIQDIPEYFFTN